MTNYRSKSRTAANVDAQLRRLGLPASRPGDVVIEQDFGAAWPWRVVQAGQAYSMINCADTMPFQTFCSSR